MLRESPLREGMHGITQEGLRHNGADVTQELQHSLQHFDPLLIEQPFELLESDLAIRVHNFITGSPLRILVSTSVVYLWSQ